MKSALNKRRVEIIDKWELHVLYDFIEGLVHFANTEFWSSPVGRVERFQRQMPELEPFIRWDEVLQRAKRIRKWSIGSPSISTFFPELGQLLDHCIKRITSVPPGLEKAESWLRAIARNATTNSDLEASIYCRSRGIDVAAPVRENWIASVRLELERYGIRKGEQAEVPLGQMAEDLQHNHLLGRFLTFRDEEEFYIDATFFRAVEWLGITGFEPWLAYLSEELSAGASLVTYPTYLATWLFYWCRSDLALKSVSSRGLESWAHRLTLGDSIRSEPWRLLNPQLNGFSSTRIAAAVPFVTTRTNTKEYYKETSDAALTQLLGLELANGGWPIFSDRAEADLLSTCMAMHALALDGSADWQQPLMRGKQWLLSQQDEYGPWYSGDCRPAPVTTLVLDSISLADRGAATFTISAEAPPDAADVSNLADLVLLTVNDIEYEAVSGAFEEICGPSTMGMSNGLTYRVLGSVNNTKIVLCRCEMGSIQLGGSLQTVALILRTLKPVAVIAVGVAFGANKAVRMGDVIVSTRIFQYEPQRVQADRILRGSKPNASTKLVQLLRSIPRERPGFGIHFGLLATGEKLIDNIDFRDQIVAEEPEVLGGEMEGSGLYAACQEGKVDWIIVKGVCDWADGNKSKNKIARQTQAAQNASCLVVEALQAADVGRGLRDI